MGRGRFYCVWVSGGCDNSRLVSPLSDTQNRNLEHRMQFIEATDGFNAAIGEK